MVIGTWMLALGFASPGALTSNPHVVPIVGGTEAATCQFPSAVSIREDDDTPTMCSGSLVHPQVVLTAAHCMIPERPIVGIGFGEYSHDFGVPEFIVAPTECAANPDWNDFGTHDVGYCILAEPVDTVPIVPLLAGCETDALQPGGEVTIVGFGATYGTYDDQGNVSATGVGEKRYTTQTIDSIDLQVGEVNMVGSDGSQSACFGDSGGPAFVRLSDDTWRVFGTGSHLYDPGGFPAPMEPGNVCGVGVAYGFASLEIAWLETQTGFDLTPCYDGDTFVGGASCGSFPTAPDVAFGTWDTTCAGGAVGGGAEVCDATGSDTSGTDGGTDDGATTSDGGTTAADTSGGGDEGTSTGAAETTTGGADDSIAEAGDDDPAGTSGGESSTSGAAETEGDHGGCGCASTGAPRGSIAIVGLVAIAIRRRRRR